MQNLIIAPCVPGDLNLDGITSFLQHVSESNFRNVMMVFGYHLRKIDHFTMAKLAQRKIRMDGEEVNPFELLAKLKDLFVVNWIPLKTLVPSFNDPDNSNPIPPAP